MIIKGIIFWFAVLVLFAQSLSAKNEIITVTNQSATSLTIQAVFPQPEKIEIKKSSRETDIYYQMDRLQLRQQAGYAIVPFATKLFSLSGSNISYTIKSADKSTKKLSGIENYLFGGSESSSTITQKSGLIEIKYQGLFRDIPLYSLTLFPVQVNPASNLIDWYKSIEIEIRTSNPVGAINTTSNTSGSERILNSKLLVNSNFSKVKKLRSLSKITAAGQRFKPNRYKISIKETGLYQITYVDLIEAEVPVDQFDTRNLKIINRGLEIPIYFKGGEDGNFNLGDYFEFWGEINRSSLTEKYADVYTDPFTDINIYWLEIGESSGLRMVEESGAQSEVDPGKFITPYAFTEKLHFEENNQFVRFGHPSADIDSLGYTMDHWFYDRGISAVGSRTYEAHLIWPYKEIGTRSVFVSAMMRGLSWSTNPGFNHQVDIWLNDEKVAESGMWKNQEMHVISNIGKPGVSQSSISHGENQLRVIMDQTAVTDRAILNWFDVSYLRRYRAEENFIKFKKQDNIPEGYILQFEVDGFTEQNISIYKLGISKISNIRVDYVTADDNYSSYRLTFQDEIFYPGIEYVAISPSAKKKPLKIELDHSWKDGGLNASLYDQFNRAEYLVITDQLFYQNSLNLKSYRESTGLAVEVVKVEDIYDEFNHGIKSPLAIKEFLQHAYNNWDETKKLLYVVLIGTASYDYRSLRSAKTDYVPTFLFKTVTHGAAGSDFPYALISGNDDVPDLIISRIPVASNSDLEAYLDKIVGYEASDNIGEWRNRSLNISGNDSGDDPKSIEVFTGQPVFRAQNQRLINLQSPDGYFTRKLNTIEDTTQFDHNFGGTNDLIDYFDEGMATVSFYGHGGGGIWADVQLMNTEDVDRLNEHYRLPFVQSMTCFTGAYENGSINGLADKLVLAPKKGAIAAFAASGVGWMYNDFALGWNVNEFLLENNLTIGEAVLFGKIFYGHNNIYVTELYDTSVPDYTLLRKSMLNHYNLLGDPYIKINIPEKSLTIELDNYLPASGDTLIATVSAPFSSGSGRLELTNELHEPLSEYYFNIQNGQSSISLVVPDNLHDQVLQIKAYAIDDFQSSDARGMERISLNQAFIDSIITQPKSPAIGDFIKFFVHLKSPEPLYRVRIRNIRGGNGGLYLLDLKAEGDSLWVYDQNFGPYLNSDSVLYDIEMIDSSGTTYLSRRNLLTISDPRPDVQISSESINFNGTTQIELSLEIINNSSVSLSGLDLAFFTDKYAPGETPFHHMNIELEPFEKKSISVPIDYSLQNPDLPFFAVVDAAGLVEESDETNNIRSVIFPSNLYVISKEHGTTITGTGNDTLSLGNFGRFYVKPGGVNVSSVMRFHQLKTETMNSLNTQPGFKYIPFAGSADSMSLNLEFGNPDAEFIHPGYLELVIDSTLYSQNELANISLCRYYTDIGRWIKVDSYTHEQHIVSEIESFGEYALFQIYDKKEPLIEITANGRTISENMYIPKNPRLGLILQDENGIDLRRGFNITIDGDSIAREDIILPDSLPNANAVSVISTPKISPGKHTLSVQVRDVNGNTAIETKEINVASDFDLHVFGNYPNPFEEVTIISFEIIAVGILQNFSVKIYTVSGRKIREIVRNERYPDEQWTPGYHEIVWDGLDKDGNLIANGVYFAVVSGTFRGKSVEQTLKLAKLK